MRYIDDYKVFNSAFVEKVKAAAKIVSSYRYDDSNGMVDYFDTNFYDWYEVKAA